MSELIKKKTKSAVRNIASVIEVKEEHFNNTQLTLFQSFYANTSEDKENASNSIELWDSVPRYSVSQKAMNEMRKAQGNNLLGLFKTTFHYRTEQIEVSIQPALIEEKSGDVVTTIAYYPSANEEIVEEALRKMAAIQNFGFHESNKRSGVIFSINQLREELRQRGHSRSFDEIIKSLNILSKSNIEMAVKGNKTKSIASSPYFPVMSSVTRDDLARDPNAKWYVQFHPLVTKSLDTLTYRQFNYQTLMSHTRQLTRYIHKILIQKYNFASKTKPFQMNFSTIERDSAMLSNYKRMTAKIDAVEFSLEELKSNNILSHFEVSQMLGPRGKINDVVYQLHPTLQFIKEVTAANARQASHKGIVGAQ